MKHSIIQDFIVSKNFESFIRWCDWKSTEDQEIFKQYKTDRHFYGKHFLVNS